VIVADILPIIRLDVPKERIHRLDLIAIDDSPDLLELFGSHQHVPGTGYGINDIHGRLSMFLDGLPEIVGKFGRHGIFQGGRWMTPVYPHRLMKARGRTKGRGGCSVRKCFTFRESRPYSGRRSPKSCRFFLLFAWQKLFFHDFSPTAPTLRGFVA